jgi:hypothetical protein
MTSPRWPAWTRPAQALDGKISLNSPTGKGTALLVDLPIEGR